MAKEKSPFIGYSVGEVFATEALSYIIIVDRDIFITNGRFVFNKKSASYYHKKIAKELLALLLDGNAKQRERAKNSLGNLRIEPLRIH